MTRLCRFILLFSLILLPVFTSRAAMESREINDVLERYGPQVRTILQPLFERAEVSYPSEKITLLVMKDRHVLELWATEGKQVRFIKRYYIWSASGELGPKLVEGDKQVPEGFYSIVNLNPNSNYHLSMELNYPNEFDLTWARVEKRHNPGGDIFIHGKSYSAGCLAMGDKNIEELFVLASDVGLENIEVIISPKDPRNIPVKPQEGAPDWIHTLYQQLNTAFQIYVSR